ncbi:RDD family protein [Anatilimnocola aggregata]|uniref:RDD family protein n=1 Tax=Anatilimnocola aggregata TaxID=2528021 RepID=A0A517YA59_9BACT|nr:RDD family protein [Anatilimnocola aggregata]QDU27116.1 RDD family protein [Anatilimnocola aggregata]
MRSPRPKNVGVYYAPSVYLGMRPRLGIFIVDSLVLGFALGTLGIISTLIAPSLISLYSPPAMILIWLYEVPLKRSSLRTVAYRLFGCKLVDLQGNPPSLLILTFRLFFWMFGFGIMFYDLVWCGIDDDHQGLRDSLAGTCLVRQQAVPLGIGRIQFPFYFTLGCNFMYPRVVHSTGATESQPAEKIAAE